MFDFLSGLLGSSKTGSTTPKTTSSAPAAKAGTSDAEWKKIYEGMVANYMQNPTPPPPAAQLDMPPQMDAMSHYRPANSMNDMAGLLSITPKYEPKPRQPIRAQNEQYIQSLLRM